MKPIRIRSYMRLSFRIIFATGLIFYCSCIYIRYPAGGKPVLLKENTALIFGRIQVIENNVDVTRDFCDPMIVFSSTDKLLTFTLLNLEPRQVALNVVAENDGSFYWILPTGLYRIINIGYRTDIDPYLAFRIEAGDRYIYIGNIVLNSKSILYPHVSLHKHKASLGTEYNIRDISVKDDFEYEANALKDRFPGRAYVAEKHLMFPNDEK